MPLAAPPHFASLTPSAFAADEARWAAVLARDPAAEGAFWFCVATTGVYCRPTCAARSPLRCNVSFLDSVEAARAAGFRACLRCRPDEPPVAARRAALVAAACRRIEEAERAPDLAELARGAGLSPHHFHRLFRAETGVTPRAYAEALKAMRAQAALAEGTSVTEALYAAGYGASSRFYEAAAGRLGMAPKRWRDGGDGEAIAFVAAPCSLGWVLAAATERGVCAITLGDDPAALEAGLRARFPRARVEPGEGGSADLLARVVALVEALGAGVALPLDVRGTAFQEQVWRALRDIPAGETVSYGELARRIGAPRAVRAVAAACGANPTAVAVPCHRVVGADGALTGYRWGVERKRALLDRERPAPPDGD